jgi:hypothetical protein
MFTLGLVTAGVADDKETLEIQTLMAPEDFTAAGLDKLTDAEREHLSGWVARYREGAIKGPAVPGKQRKEEAAIAATAAAVAPDKGEATAESSQLAAEETTPEVTDEYPGGYRTNKEKKKKTKFELVAKVIPVFSGWSGKTVFVLDNGQVWRQRTPGKLRYSDGDSNITIRQNIIGKFIMTHPDSGRSVGVRRID